MFLQVAIIVLVFIQSASSFSKRNYRVMVHFSNVFFGMVHVIVIPLFPFIFWYSYTNSLRFCWCWCYALIKGVFRSAFPLHKTIFFLSTIIWKFLTFIWRKYVLIVASYYLRNIFSATLTYFNWVAVEYFMQFVIFWKMFI